VQLLIVYGSFRVWFLVGMDRIFSGMKMAISGAR